MIKKTFLLLALVCITSAFAASLTQANRTHKLQTKPMAQNYLDVAIFIPLQLAKIYPEHTDKIYIKDTFNVSYPETEWAFYVGTKMAVDSLLREKHTPFSALCTPRFQYYDISDNLVWEAFRQAEKKPNLIISFVGHTHFDTLAAYADQEKIPFISALYPKAGAQANNTSLVVLNPTLEIHIKKTIQRMSSNYIHILLKKNEYPHIIQPILRDLQNDTTLKNKKFTFSTIGDSVEHTLRERVLSKRARRASLFLLTFDNDVIRRTIRYFSTRLPQDYNYTLGGMPFWENLPFVRSFTSKTLSLFYAVPRYYHDENPLFERLKNIYYHYYFSPFSNMTAYGFESLMQFTHVAMQYNARADFSAHLNDSTFQVFDNFDFYSAGKRITKEMMPPSASCVLNEHVHFILQKDRKTSFLE